MKVIRQELDRFKDETIAKAHMSVCDGSCENHQGLVKPFRVFDKETGFDWGYFSYCEEAQREDTESRGMELVLADDSVSVQSQQDLIANEQRESDDYTDQRMREAENHGQCDKYQYE